MNSLINTTFNRSYNPSGGQNALSNIKRLLTSRDTNEQSKACGYVCEVIKRLEEHPEERTNMVDYLLNNDITVFLCEAMCNLDWSLFGIILGCLRLLWRSRRFFADEHDAHASSAVVRALVHYSSTGHHAAVDSCLHFLCDLLAGVHAYDLRSPMSSDSAYNAEQLLSCLNILGSHPSTRSSTVLASALVLQALISHQPTSLKVRGSTTNAVVETLNQWFPLLLRTLNQVYLKGEEGGTIEMFYAVICQLGVDVVTLNKAIRETKGTNALVESILNDDQEIADVIQCSIDMEKSVHAIILELVNFTKENHKQLPTAEYSLFLTFLHKFLAETRSPERLTEFSDFLFSKGYLMLLPQVHISRGEVSVRKVSTLVLGEMLRLLSKKYLDIDSSADIGSCENYIQMGLVELQYGIEKPQAIGLQLQNQQSYCLVIYLYFFCQSSENPQEAMSPLLPHFVQHILRLPTAFKPPKYIIKSLWLVFAMSTISHAPLETLNERICFERAISRFVQMLEPNVSTYYTHNPALLLWSFTSERIPISLRINVLSQWFEEEDYLPTLLATQSIVWELLLELLTNNLDECILSNAIKALRACLEEVTEETKDKFASSLWYLLPEILSKVLIDDFNTGINIRHILELATVLIPLEVDPMVCFKIGVVISAIFSKTTACVDQKGQDKLHYEYICLKLCLYTLELVDVKKDSRVLSTYVHRPKFLPSVLHATNNDDARVACTALQLLSYIIHYYANLEHQPRITLEVEASKILCTLHRDGSNERGAALVQMVYMILNAGISSPLTFSTSVTEATDATQAYTTLRGLMFRIQMMCCKESKSQSSAAWKTLSAIFKYGVMSKNDPELVACLTTQPWTQGLIQFQLSQGHTEEFLTFTRDWLVLLRIVIATNQEHSSRSFIIVNKQSMLHKTLTGLKKYLSPSDEADDVICDLKKRILSTVAQFSELDSRSFNSESQVHA